MPDHNHVAVQSDDLISLYRGMMLQDPGSAVLAALLAQEFCSSGAYQAAVTAANTALEIDDCNLAARLTRGQSLRALGQLDEAAADLAVVAARHPAPAAILVMLALVEIARGRHDRAVRMLDRAIYHDPHCADAYATLGAVHARQGRQAAALLACRRALEQDSLHIAAHQNLAALLAATAPDVARVHQDAAYRQRQIFVTASSPGALTALVLTCAAAASVPLEHLLPASRYGQVQWFIDYARPDQDLQLPAHDFIFNAIGDADLMPEIHEPVSRLLASTAKPVFNYPDRTCRTHRSALPALLAGIPDIVVPAVSRIGPDDQRAWQSRHSLPVIVRPTGSHGGHDVERATTEAAVHAKCRLHESCYVTDFIDYRSRADEMYWKYRVIFVDRIPYPYHLAIGPHWLVHYWTAGMENSASRRAEELRFLTDPAAAIGQAAMAALGAIGTRLDLDYGGIDFSILPDGRLLVFEANATMLVHPEQDPVFAYKNPAVATILSAFERMIASRVTC